MSQKKSWVVKMKCEITKELIVDGCSESEAREDPFGQDVLEERELSQEDYQVLSVEENT